MYRKNIGVYIGFGDVSSLGSAMVLACASDTFFVHLISSSARNRV